MIRRAGRDFPTRQALLEAVYVGEIGAMAHAAEELADADAGEALASWFADDEQKERMLRIVLDGLRATA